MIPNWEYIPIPICDQSNVMLTILPECYTILQIIILSIFFHYQFIK